MHYEIPYLRAAGLRIRGVMRYKVHDSHFKSRYQVSIGSGRYRDYYHKACNCAGQVYDDNHLFLFQVCVSEVKILM